MAEDERLAALLGDLNELADYLHGRGRSTYQLAQRFLEHARSEQDLKTRAYDENQAKMLDYQHYIWHEIAGLVEKLIQRYSDEAPSGAGPAGAQPPEDA
jgi:hypothetical protein